MRLPGGKCAAALNVTTEKRAVNRLIVTSAVINVHCNSGNKEMNSVSCEILQQSCFPPPRAVGDSSFSDA